MLTVPSSEDKAPVGHYRWCVILIFHLEGVNGWHQAREGDEGEEVPSKGCHHYHHKEHPETGHYLQESSLQKMFNYSFISIFPKIC